MNELRDEVKTKFIPLSIFAISMGFLEAIVVVYMRELYYPDGFGFPLKILPTWIMGIEIIREFCTLLMLFTVAWISGKNFLQRLAIFLFLFGIWDIFYYIALKLFLGWPETLLTWDLLFLIPITWIGPVLAPIICSFVMIIMTLIFEYFRLKNNSAKIKWTELGLMFGGAIIIYFTFTYDVGKLILKGNYLSSLLHLTENQKFIKDLSTFVPTHFLWIVFILGLLIILSGIALFIKRNLKDNNL